MEDLPNNVILTIRHEAPTGEVDSISRLTSEGRVLYNVTFRDPVKHPDLTIRDDGRLVK